MFFDISDREKRGEIGAEDGRKVARKRCDACPIAAAVDVENPQTFSPFLDALPPALERLLDHVLLLRGPLDVVVGVGCRARDAALEGGRGRGGGSRCRSSSSGSRAAAARLLEARLVIGVKRGAPSDGRHRCSGL